jgi:ubiquinone/menaquinone biosynthesis C-methylase UbiE
MSGITSRDGERLIPEKFDSKNDYLAFLKHLYAYTFLGKYKNKNHLALEIGFGTGYGTKFSSSFFSKIIGLEVDPEPISYAQKKYPESNIEYKQYNGSILPFPDNFFDIVYSFQVIEHVTSDSDFLSEARRVLKTGGILVITTPNRNYRLKPGEKPKNKFHLREYSPDDLKNIGEKFFQSYSLLGLYGKGEVHQIELDRVKSGLGHLDPLGIRHLLPVAFKLKLKKMMNVLKGHSTLKIEDQDFMTRYSTEDYFLDEKNISDSLDLYFVAKKS